MPCLNQVFINLCNQLCKYSCSNKAQKQMHMFSQMQRSTHKAQNTTTNNNHNNNHNNNNNKKKKKKKKKKKNFCF